MRMTDENEHENEQITEKAIPVGGFQLCGSTLRLLLQPRGVVGISNETFKAVRYLGIEIDPQKADEIDAIEGSPGLMEFKDNILRDLDTRLMALLDL